MLYEPLRLADRPAAEGVFARVKPVFSWQRPYKFPDICLDTMTAEGSCPDSKSVESSIQVGRDLLGSMSILSGRSHHKAGDRWSEGVVMCKVELAR